MALYSLDEWDLLVECWEWVLRPEVVKSIRHSRDKNGNWIAADSCEGGHRSPLKMLYHSGGNEGLSPE